MRTEEFTTVKITAEDGYVFATVDKSQVYGNEMYLAKEDRSENYIEITEEEAEEIKLQKEK